MPPFYIWTVAGAVFADCARRRYGLGDKIGMSWKVEYLPATGLVAVTAAGEVSDEDARAQVEQVIGLLKQHQTTLVLVDYSEALSEVSLPSLYRLPDSFLQCGGPWNVRVAVVLPHSRYRNETYQFFKLVCGNAGYDVRLFDQRDAAEEWLEHDQLSKLKPGPDCGDNATVLARAPCG